MTVARSVRQRVFGRLGAAGPLSTTGGGARLGAQALIFAEMVSPACSSLPLWPLYHRRTAASPSQAPRNNEPMWARRPSARRWTRPSGSSSTRRTARTCARPSGGLRRIRKRGAGSSPRPQSRRTATAQRPSQWQRCRQSCSRASARLSGVRLARSACSAREGAASARSEHALHGHGAMLRNTRRPCRRRPAPLRLAAVWDAVRRHDKVSERARLNGFDPSVDCSISLFIDARKSDQARTRPACRLLALQSRPSASPSLLFRRLPAQRASNWRPRLLPRSWCAAQRLCRTVRAARAASLFSPRGRARRRRPRPVPTLSAATSLLRPSRRHAASPLMSSLRRHPCCRACPRSRAFSARGAHAWLTCPSRAACRCVSHDHCYADPLSEYHPAHGAAAPGAPRPRDAAVSSLCAGRTRGGCGAGA